MGWTLRRWVHFRRSSIEMSDFAVTVDHHDRHINRIKDARHIGAYGIGDVNVALHPAELRDLRLAFFGHSADSFES